MVHNLSTPIPALRPDGVYRLSFKMRIDGMSERVSFSRVMALFTNLDAGYIHYNPAMYNDPTVYSQFLDYFIKYLLFIGTFFYSFLASCRRLPRLIWADSHRRLASGTITRTSLCRR
jgi:hypothetical protein